MTDIQWTDRSTVELIKTNASDQDVAYAAWVSNYASQAKVQDTGKIEGLINFLWREFHTSPFEHGSYTFFVDTPIFVSREYLRHRTQSYNETSSRYKELEARFYLPNEERPLVQTGKIGSYQFVPGTKEQYDRMIEWQSTSVRVAWAAYQGQLDDGVAREVARNVLPLNTMTQFYATVNPLNALRFFSLRNEEQALHEIRAVAAIEEEMFKKVMPLTWKAFNKSRETQRKIKRLLELVDLDELLADLEAPVEHVVS